MNEQDPNQEPPVVKWVKAYVDVRDYIKVVEERHKKELEEAKATLGELAGRISGFLNEHGLENLKTTYGTCYKSIRHSASLADPAVFMSYVIQNERWELLDKKANVTAVRDFVKNEKVLPPGVNLTSIEAIRVNRGTGGKDDD